MSILCHVLKFESAFSFRFDLIFLMLDPQDELYDRRLATHLVSLYHQTQEQEDEEHLVSGQIDGSALLGGPSGHWNNKSIGWHLLPWRSFR